MSLEWTAEQTNLLTDLIPTGMAYPEIADRISALGTHRSPQACEHKARVIGAARRNPGPVQWPGERNELMLKWWADDISAGVIAKRLGVTRNAVMGRIHRLGLQRGRQPVARFSSRPKKRYDGEQRATVTKFGPVLKKQPPLPPSVIDAQIPVEQRKQLLDLNTNDCRWPVGDVGEPGFFFCGGKAEDGCSYCPAHTLRSIGTREPFAPRPLWRAA